MDVHGIAARRNLGWLMLGVGLWVEPAPAPAPGFARLAAVGQETASQQATPDPSRVVATTTRHDTPGTEGPSTDAAPSHGVSLRDHALTCIELFELAGVPLGDLRATASNPRVRYRVAPASDAERDDFAWTTQSGANVVGAMLGISDVSPIITIHRDLARELDDGRVQDAQGTPTRAVTTLIHESVHAMVLLAGVKAPGLSSGELIEMDEAFCHDLEQMVKASHEAASILSAREDAPSRPLAPGAAQRLTRLLAQLQTFGKNFQPYLPNDPEDNTPAKAAARTAYIDRVLGMLGWEDDDDNHLPDWLDAALQARGVDALKP